MGDLNFRLENITKNEAEQLIVENRLSELLKHDQVCFFGLVSSVLNPLISFLSRSLVSVKHNAG